MISLRRGEVGTEVDFLVLLERDFLFNPKGEEFIKKVSILKFFLLLNFFNNFECSFFDVSNSIFNSS